MGKKKQQKNNIKIILCQIHYLFTYSFSSFCDVTQHNIAYINMYVHTYYIYTPAHAVDTYSIYITKIYTQSVYAYCHTYKHYGNLKAANDMQ